METDAPWQDIAGIAFRDGNRIVKTPAAPLADLDELAPPARHLIPMGRYRALGMPVSMTTSRGCPFNCIFCVGRKMVGARVRYRDPVRVVDEMERLSVMDFHQINLADDWRRYHANRAVIRTAGVQSEAMDAVVIDGERQFLRWLGEIARLREAGRSTAEAIWPLVRLEHTVVIYDMMMKRLIEDKGSWPAEASDETSANPTGKLIHRLSGELDHPPARIRAAIEFAAGQRYLTRHSANGRIHWSWVDYL